MTKKRILSLLMLIVILIITGCTSSNPDSETIPKQFTIGGNTIKLDQNFTFHDLDYKVGEGLTHRTTDLGDYISYVNKDVYDGEFVFQIIVYYNEGKTINDVAKFVKEDKEVKEINGIKWTTYKTTSNRIEGYAYLAEINNNLYAINITKYDASNTDLEGIATVFMKQVSIHK